MSDIATLDPQRIRELFDLRSDVYANRGGGFDLDFYPELHRLRETGPVHPGIVGPLVGYHGEAFFQGLPFPDLPHFSVFDFATCQDVLRDGDTFVSKPTAPGPELDLSDSVMLYFDGDRHRRYRALVQSSFVPKRGAWWSERWIESTVQELIDTFERNGRADLNVEFCAPIPLLTICGSFGIGVADALRVREAATSDGGDRALLASILMPIISERRKEPRDDIISVLVQAEVAEGDGPRQVLSDVDILGFALLLLAAGSGTTWKQMGITLLALLRHPRWLEAVRADRTLLRPAIEESLRWMPTDPMFTRYALRDTELGGVAIPARSVVHLCFAAANRDPARWERPDEFDPSRPPGAHLGFGGGPHICLGMHVARAEIHTAIDALLDRLPGLRLDEDAEAPQIIGMYERGPTSVPVVWDTP
ncbi:cytochrome P450 [Frankia sp. AgB1.9]|uniref:cytochrome P450 n=1 Tax=unclassified Frankia TaxID=2632575 RepID=UPI0019342EAB|nr:MULTISPECIES: cytochrome P450 [unclassified Frankia]MBL7489952.1 cytochrome P450 [Frankia sp. AgW1.1]MBL7552160.1 cytochrome P450 [Frankia sp. AgB1.9]MBL7625243.1 cytochrome P450 [Frankia sp. AgB1.8]